MEARQRTAAVIHRDRLIRNIERVRARLGPGVEILAVVKADGYGHGAAGLLPAMRKCGVRYFAAAYWEEGAELRRAGAENEEILLLCDTWDEQLPELLRWRLTPTVFAVETAEKLNALAREAGVVHPIHIKLDTGMNRIGFPADERCYEPIARIAAMENLKITGMFTHFARADELDCDYTEHQFDRFTRTAAALRARGIEIPMVHAANSPSIMLRPEVQLDAVRAGDVMYGLPAADEETWAAAGFEEILTWHTYVVLVKTIPAGASVGYGGTFVAPREMTIATIPVGFADGYSRKLSNKGGVYIRGRYAPIVGRVCMDQMMVDVTGIPGVARGDVVDLIGGGMTVVRMADLAGLNVDEITCGISKRVPRVYLDGE